MNATSTITNVTKPRAFITGITGQDGSYLAELLLAKGYEVHGLVRRASSFNTDRIDGVRHQLHLHYGDVTDAARLAQLVRQVEPDEFYNLAAQSHVRVSFDEPLHSCQSITVGAMACLEACRQSPLAKSLRFYQASSSEMFGNSSTFPQDELTPFAPVSPYGCAKLFAHHLAVNYREAYGLHVSCGILFNHECVTAQTPVVVRKNGIVDIRPIEEIVPHRSNPRHGLRQSTICSDNSLEVWDGGKWSRVTTMTATWNNPDKNGKSVVRVNCRGGFYEATADHLSPRKGCEFVPTETLNPGDLLETRPLPDHHELSFVSNEEAEFLGMMAADGWVGDGENSGKGRFTKNSHELRLRMLSLWERLTAGTAKHGQSTSGFSDNKVSTVEFRGCAEYLRYIRPQLYTESGHKRIPKRILNASLDAKLCFLRAYNRCDGLKAGNGTSEFKSFKTNSPTLAAGLWMLMNQLGFRVTSHPDFKSSIGGQAFALNINSENGSGKGKHLRKPIDEVKSVERMAYVGWLFDLETESGTFSAGIGLTWIHNSPRRGESFVTRKITRWVGRAMAYGDIEPLLLGHLNSSRDWGFAGDYVRAMWLMLQRPEPDDYVIATGVNHSVAAFLSAALQHSGRSDELVKLVHADDSRYLRPVELSFLRGCADKARRVLGWRPEVDFTSLVRMMVNHDFTLARREKIAHGDHPPD